MSQLGFEWAGVYEGRDGPELYCALCPSLEKQRARAAVRLASRDGKCEPRRRKGAK
jgi:hypothetical protein